MATNIILAILWAGMGACAWALFCNSRTYKQRLRVIDVVYDSPDWQRLRGHYRAVSYDRHLLCLMALRDPLPMYGDEISRLVSGRS